MALPGITQGERPITICFCAPIEPLDLFLKRLQIIQILGSSAGGLVFFQIIETDQVYPQAV